MELDGLKSKTNVGIEAREVSERIEAIQTKELNESKKSFERLYNQDWTGLESLPRDVNDFIILANVNWLVRNRKSEFDKIKFISKDRNLRIIARDMFKETDVVVEDYYQDQSEDQSSTEMPEINVDASIICFDNKNYWFELDSLSVADQDRLSTLPFNSGVICWSNWDGCFDGQIASKDNSKYKASFVAINKGTQFIIIDKLISAYGVSQYSMSDNGLVNWQQVVALAQLADKDIKAVFLQGGAGTGKTLLAVAAALEQYEQFAKIMITRPQIHDGDEDRMGYLPGGVTKKMDPWLAPIWQALDHLKNGGGFKSAKKLDHKFNKGINNSAEFIEKLKKDEKFIVQPLGYIRGQSIKDTFLIVDEAQNLTAREMRTIITRMGENSRVVFTGDLSQIDRKYLDRQSSGLAYSADKLTNRDNIFDDELSYGPTIVAISTFKESVRSALARYAEKVL
jgi:PhoH-like ATPase